MILEDKIKDVFEDMIVLKDPKRTSFFSDLSLPSYMRDWLVMKFSDDKGNIDYESVSNYIKSYIPSKADFEQMKYDMINGDDVLLLARIRVMVDIKKGETIFELPDFGGISAGAGGSVDRRVIEDNKETLLKENENWGIVQLVWTQDFSKTKPTGQLQLINYQPFCPYTIDLDFYREARQEFTIQEWIDVLISAIDYNPAGFTDENGTESEKKKLVFLRRLLPFIEKRINMIELAPKGTGKSYVYEKISKRGWLVSSGKISRASLLYDNQKKMSGLLARYDYVGFDESQSIHFEPASEIQAALKSYMEFGEIKGFDATIPASAGVIVLGNIDADRFDVHANMVEELNPIFRESATLDRFHGFIPGWEIPRMKQDMIANGWALNTEYFAEVLHEMRGEMAYTGIVERSIKVPHNADKRDLTAIQRLCTALVKLLYPNAQQVGDIPEDEFVHYCLEPAKEMRQAIRTQLGVIDPKEYKVPGKLYIPDIQYAE